MVFDHFQVDYRFAAKDSSRKGCYNCKEGKVWHDNWGYSCLTYFYGNFCTTEGKTGDRWKLEHYGSISSYENGGQDAFKACRACGGGLQT